MVFKTVTVLSPKSPMAKIRLMNSNLRAVSKKKLCGNFFEPVIKLNYKTHMEEDNVS